jgi:hypothetical protein
MSFLLDNKKIELNNMTDKNNIVCNIEMDLTKLSKTELLAKCEENGIKKCKTKNDIESYIKSRTNIYKDIDWVNFLFGENPWCNSSNLHKILKLD